MDDDVQAASFATRLNAERESLKAFIALLETEQQTLAKGHVEQLPELTENKILAAQELNKLENARKSDLLAHGVAISADSIENWLTTHLPASLPVWHEILRLAAQAQYINNINGTLIQTRLRHNQQMLTVLHNAANNAQGLYGPDGQPKIPSTGRTLGSV